jgi:tRNA (cytidine32/uridine32-2'-O)-methyltransferase
MEGLDAGGPPQAVTPDGPAPDPGALDRLTVVLSEPRDLVNVALVIRAMKNMGTSRLRLVRPVEFDAWRILGIAHDTEDVVDTVEVHDELAPALADASYVLGATARRRSTRQDWWTPEQAARELLARGEPVALLLGREDRGLSNDELDLCHGLVHIPANPEHRSLNLAHAALVVLYEWRKAWLALEEAEPPDLAHKRHKRAPPATHAELEEFFGIWEQAMDEVGFFRHIDPLPKMRSFRALFQRADLDRRELGLMRAAAYEILHHAVRATKRARERAKAEIDGDP